MRNSKSTRILTLLSFRATNSSKGVDLNCSIICIRRISLASCWTESGSVRIFLNESYVISSSGCFYNNKTIVYFFQIKKRSHTLGNPGDEFTLSTSTVMVFKSLILLVIDESTSKKLLMALLINKYQLKFLPTLRGIKGVINLVVS